jgi:hypothetical protein
MVVYLTRTGTVGGAPTNGVETELTSAFDDAAPGRYTVPSGISRIVEIRVASVVHGDAADDDMVVGIRLRGAVGIVPTIAVAAGGTGNAGTPLSTDLEAHPFMFKTNIPLLQGKNLEVYALGHGTANTDLEIAITLVMV